MPPTTSSSTPGSLPPAPTSMDGVRALQLAQQATDALSRRSFLGTAALAVVGTATVANFLGDADAHQKAFDANRSIKNGLGGSSLPESFSGIQVDSEGKLGSSGVPTTSFVTDYVDKKVKELSSLPNSSSNSKSKASDVSLDSVSGLSSKNVQELANDLSKKLEDLNTLVDTNGSQNKANLIHGHVISDVGGLQSSLNGKANLIHNHGIGDIADLQTTLNSKADVSMVSNTSPWNRTGTNTVLANAGDKVGIGTSSPVYDLQIRKALAPQLGIHTTASSQNPGIIMTDGVNGKGWWIQHETFPGVQNAFSIANANTDANGNYVSAFQLRLVITSNGNVGIGTTAPLHPLHVEENINNFTYTAKIRNINAGTGASSALRVDSDTGVVEFGVLSSANTLWGGYGALGDSFIRSGGNTRHLNIISAEAGPNRGNINFYAGGGPDAAWHVNPTPTSTMTLKSRGFATGLVGIGTMNPTAKLHIENTPVLGVGTISTDGVTTTITGVGTQFLSQLFPGSSIFIPSAGLGFLVVSVASNTSFTTNYIGPVITNQPFEIATSGLLVEKGGIINSNHLASNSATEVTLRKRGTVGDTDAAVVSGAELGYIGFRGWNGSGYARGAFIISHARENFTTLASGSELSFFTTPVGSTTNTQIMRIGGGNSARGVEILNNTDSNHNLRLSNTLNNKAWNLYHLNSTDVNPNGFLIEHFNGSTYSRLLEISQNGNVGIGTSTPTSKLTIGDGGIFVGLNTAVGDSLVLNNNTSSNLQIKHDATAFVKILNSAGDTANDGIIFRNGTSTTDILSIVNNGNVGIGTSTPASTLSVNGSISHSFNLINFGAPVFTPSPFIITNTMHTITCSNGVGTFELPPASTAANREYRLVAGSGANLTVTSPGSVDNGYFPLNTINGGSPGTIWQTINGFQSITIMSNGSNWYQIA